MVAQPVAIGGDLNQFGILMGAVEDGGGGGDVVDLLAPVFQRAIQCHQRAARFVPPHAPLVNLRGAGIKVELRHFAYFAFHPPERKRFFPAEPHQEPPNQTIAVGEAVMRLQLQANPRRREAASSSSTQKNGQKRVISTWEMLSLIGIESCQFMQSRVLRFRRPQGNDSENSRGVNLNSLEQGH